jgi:hypothetical protein
VASMRCDPVSVGTGTLTPTLTKAEYVSLISRCDSAATVSKTSDGLPIPDAGDHRELPLENVQRHVAETVLPGVPDLDRPVDCRLTSRYADFRTTYVIVAGSNVHRTEMFRQG